MNRIIRYNQPRARYRGESLRPDLWPDHAWIPALGVTGSTLFDVAGKDNIAITGSYSWVGTSKGLMVDQPSASYYTLPSELNTKFATMAGLSVVFTAICDSVGSDQRIFGSFGDADETRQIAIWMDSDGSGPSWAAVVSGVSNIGVIGTRVSAGVPYTVAFRRESSFYDVHVNGVLDSIYSGTHSIPNESTSLQYKWGKWDGFGDFDGKLGPLLIYYRSLASAQIRDLSADPMLPFRRREFAGFYVPSVAASFNPYWVNHNQIIGVGA